MNTLNLIQKVEKLGALRPAFKRDGSVTAGNASGINDGAAALLVMSAEKAKVLGIKPLCTIVTHASAGSIHQSWASVQSMQCKKH